MFSGSSCEQSTVRRTCCFGSPVRTSNRKSTRVPLRKKLVPSMKTTFLYCRQERWVWMLGFERWSTGRCRTRRHTPLKMRSCRSTHWCTGTPTHDSSPPTSISRLFTVAPVPPQSPSANSLASSSILCSQDWCLKHFTSSSPNLSSSDHSILQFSSLPTYSSSAHHLSSSFCSFFLLFMPLLFICFNFFLIYLILFLSFVVTFS